MDNREIAIMIIKQMGGMGRIKAMVGATNFIYGDSNIKFHFKGNKEMNIVEIQLTDMDLYNMKFYKYKPKKVELIDVKEIKGLYDDMLKPVFESETGLYLSF